MRKRVYSAVLLTSMMMLLSGCRMYADYTVNGDGTVTVSSKVAYTPEEVGFADTNGMTLQTLEDGKQYYVSEEVPETQKVEDVKDESGVLTEDIFVYRLGSPEDVAQSTTDSSTAQQDIYIQVGVTLVSDIVESNADVSVAGKKAVFSSNGQQQGCWYAYTQKGKEMVSADNEAPKMKGAKNEKYYKEMPTNIRFEDNVSVGQIYLNDKVVFPATSSVTVNDKTTVTKKWLDINNDDASKKGKNVFKVTDVKGNVSTFTIYIDARKPVIKGVKANKSYKGKATIYVKDSNKLSKVTINGKKQKLTKKQLVKSGKYEDYYKYTITKQGTNKIVATDAAGNKKTLKIKVTK